MKDSMDLRSNQALRALATAGTRGSHETPQCRHPVAHETGPAGYPTPASVAKKRGRLVAKGMDPDLCCQRSSHVVAGVHYCGQHAGIAALNALIGDGMAKKLKEE